jgi:uncharacterized protein YbaA (DUF1428 family)
MSYVDGYIVPVPEGNIEAYRQMAEAFAAVAKENGALQIVEAVADDVKEGKWTDFYRAVDRQPSETVIFSWVVFPSREARDAAWGAIMEDPRMKAMMDSKIFDGNRMIWGGFKPIVSHGL